MESAGNILLAHSTITDGNMSVTWAPEAEVEENRKKFLAKHGLKREDAVIMDLAHDDKVAVVGRKAAGEYVRAEALITREVGLPLMVLTADCNPVALYDPVHKVIALVHLSWQTTTLSLSKKTVVAMQEKFGTAPTDLLVSIGPSARKGSYIQTEVKQREHPEWGRYLTDVAGGTAIDVLGFNIDQLVAAGVRREHISVDSTDTITSKNYYSHYRSVRTGEPEGRFATVAVLR